MKNCFQFNLYLYKVSLNCGENDEVFVTGELQVNIQPLETRTMDDQTK
jgi:hypothetical protein